MHGQGTLYFVFGGKYVGGFKKDKLNGECIHFNADGSIFGQGVYKDNQFQYSKKIAPDNQKNIPKNAYASGNSWKCKSGYVKSGNVCKVQELIKDQLRSENKQLIRDKCFLNVYDASENWTENDAEHLCSLISKNHENLIYSNCLMAKAKGKKHKAINAAGRICMGISKSPSTFQTLKYGMQFSSYLGFLN